MAGFENTKVNRPYMKDMYLKNKQTGEKLLANNFRLVIEGYESLHVLVRSTQYPAMGYADVEDFAQGGLQMVQSGSLENSGEITVTATETIKGDVFKTLKNIILNKKQVDIKLHTETESIGGAIPFSSCKMLDCKLRSDAVEYSAEDQVALVKPSFTIKYGWVDHEGIDY